MLAISSKSTLDLIISSIHNLPTYLFFRQNKEILKEIFNIKDLLQAIADLDKKCLTQGEFLRDEIQKELSTVRQGWKAARKYTQQTGFQPRFMDLRR